MVLLMVVRIRTYDRLLSVQHRHPASTILRVTGHYNEALGAMLRTRYTSSILDLVLVRWQNAAGFC